MSILLPFILYPSRKPISLDFVTEFISFLFCFLLGLVDVHADISCILCAAAQGVRGSIVN